MLASAALKPDTWLIGNGSVMVDVEPVPVPVPVPPPELLLCRTWLNVSGVVLGGTCHVSVQVVKPSVLLYVAT
jgi:hypothetical protein